MCDRLTIWSTVEAGKRLIPMDRLLGTSAVTRVCHSNWEFPEHDGALSIKTVAHGREVYHFDGGSAAVVPGSYLILNEGQRYGSSMDTSEDTEGFCFWFRDGMAEEISRTSRQSHDEMLDEPFHSKAGKVRFYDRLYPDDRQLTPILDETRTRLIAGESDPAWLEERLQLILERMMAAQNVIRREVASLPAVRPATRDELYRRLHRAKDFAEAHLSAPISLQEMASVACLSPHHFLRTFKGAFGETPQQYRSRRRMEEARSLLVKTDRPVTEICFEVGFESLGTFSWHFAQRFGMPPSEYRSRFAPRKNRIPEEANGDSNN